MNKKREIASMIFFAAGCLLAVAFAIISVIDSLNYNQFYSAPLYVYIMVDSLTTLLPSIICFVTSLIIKKYKAKK